MKKVVFFVPSLHTGGMERVLVNYANLFSDRGYDVTVLNFTGDDKGIVSGLNGVIHYQKNYMPVQNPLHASKNDLFRLNFRLLPWKWWIKLHSAEYLYKKYINGEYDVEIAFFGSEAIKIVSGSNKSNSIAWIHNVNVGSYIKPLGSYRKAKKVYHSIHKIVCVSNAAQKEIFNVFQRNDNVYVVNNPNDTKQIRKKAEEAYIEKNGLFTFVTVARFFDKQKGFIRLFGVVRRLLDEGYMFNLWLVGDGIDYERVKQDASSKKLTNVSFWGNQANPYPFIKCADMYLSPSYYEGFSMVMMEAVILGKPMLTTDVSGADEMLNGGEYGMIVDNTEEGIYEGMKTILDSTELYKHYCLKAEERKNYLSEEIIMDQVEAILED